MTVLNELSAQLLANYAKKRNQQIDSMKDRVGKDDRLKHFKDADDVESGDFVSHARKNIKRSEDKWKAKDESERAGTLDRARGFEKEKSVANTVRSALGMKDKDNAEEREKAGRDKAFQALADRVEQHDLSRRAVRQDATPQEMEAQRKSRVALAQRQVKDISGRDSIRHMASGLKQGAKVVAKAGYNAAKSGLSSLKKRVFGEEYYEDLDYRYTVIPLLDSLLEGNYSDIEYAFNEAVAHRIENAILTARLRIAEELDEARAGFVHDVMDSDGSTTTNFVRPTSPAQRKELADGIRSTRRQNRQIRDDIVDNPYDRKDVQKSELDQANANSRGVRSAYKAKNYETTKMQGTSPREGGRKASHPYMADQGYRTGAVDFDEKGNAKPRFPGASRVNVEYGKHIRAGDGKAPKRKREIFPQD